MATIDKLDNTGILKVKGELDEVTGSAVSTNGTAYLAAGFDEITISPISSGLAKRVHANGLIQVANYFDDYSLNAFVTSGLVVYLDADSYPGSGTTWPDISGNGNDTTLVAPDYYAGPPAYLNFTGSNYGILGPVINKNAYTKCAMIYLDAYYSNNILSGRGDAPHAFWMGSSQNIRAGHDGNWDGAVGATELNLNQWYFVACTFDTTDGFKLYVNGALDGTYTNNAPFTGSDPGDCNIGAFQDGNNFYGRIPVALVYNRVLDGTEIQTVFGALRGRFGI
jgi:hypothetical protein